jgi:hypothetical protein
MQSTLFTIGTALSRARDHGVVVRVLVAGHWIEGMVSEVDGHGVVLTGAGTDHHVVRVEAIAAVKVPTLDPLQPDDEPSRPAGEDVTVEEPRLPVMAVPL